MSIITPIKTRSIVDELVRSIEEAVDKGELHPGQQLVEEQLTLRWQVSRSSLREAFRVLDSSGYVEHRARKGVFISDITPRSARELYEVRAVLEGLAARLAVERGNPDVLEQLKQLHEEMTSAAKNDNNVLYSELNQSFHRLIIEASGNELLQKQLVPLNKMAKRYRRLAHMDTELLVDSGLSHLEVIHCMEAHDGVKAELQRRAHILKFAEIIVQKLTRYRS